MDKVIKLLCVTLLIAGGIIAAQLLPSLEAYALNQWAKIEPAGDMDIEQEWIPAFLSIAVLSIYITTALIAVWAALTAWVLKTTRWQRIGVFRLFWLGLGGLAVIGDGIMLFLMPAVQSGFSALVLVQLVNSLLVFWFITSLFTPPAYKYIPPISRLLRSLVDMPVNLYARWGLSHE